VILKTLLVAVFFVCFFSPLAWCGLVVFQFSVFSFLFGFSVLLLLPFHLRAVWHWSFALLQTLGKFCLCWIRNRCRHFLAHKVMWQIFHKYIWPAGERVQQPPSELTYLRQLPGGKSKERKWAITSQNKQFGKNWTLFWGKSNTLYSSEMMIYYSSYFKMYNVMHFLV